MGRRRVLLAVAGGELTVRTIGPLKVRETRLAVSDVTAIRVGPSGMSVNDRPIMELQIVPRDGKKIGLLSQRTEDELRWLDAVLRQAAGMG